MSDQIVEVDYDQRTKEILNKHGLKSGEHYVVQNGKIQMHESTLKAIQEAEQKEAEEQQSAPPPKKEKPRRQKPASSPGEKRRSIFKIAYFAVPILIIVGFHKFFPNEKTSADLYDGIENTSSTTRKIIPDDVVYTFQTASEKIKIQESWIDRKAIDEQYNRMHGTESITESGQEIRVKVIGEDYVFDDIELNDNYNPNNQPKRSGTLRHSEELENGTTKHVFYTAAQNPDGSPVGVCECTQTPGGFLGSDKVDITCEALQPKR